MMGLIRVHKLEPCSLVNGPGRRFVIWFQGCPFDCEGCFNQEARAFEGGEMMSVADIGRMIFASDVHGVTLSGGEPFLQAPEAASLLRECGRRGLDRMVYTGFHFGDLKKDVVPGARELLKATDLLMDGPFRRDVSPDGEWTGSGNQRVIALSPGGMTLKKLRRTSLVEQEYIIDREGGVVKTGI
ncbi:MAG: 4Fe-4S single cluster domain-containing protein [Spirochaetales bacterium]|nr:4Fe-4S single cluster domain-containing protein [Spirochaetales bacterium]